MLQAFSLCDVKLRGKSNKCYFHGNSRHTQAMSCLMEDKVAFTVWHCLQIWDSVPRHKTSAMEHHMNLLVLYFCQCGKQVAFCCKHRNSVTSLLSAHCSLERMQHTKYRDRVYVSFCLFVWFS